MITQSAWCANTTVSMVNSFQFSPKDITVNAGDTVTWVNQSFASHDSTSGTNGIPSGLWHSPLFGSGGSFSFTFNGPAGYYGYYCTPHVFTFNMVGSVTVVAPNAPPSVTITNPIDNASFPAGTNILVEATASDSDGSVAQVNFSVNGNPAGSAFNAPYRLSLNNVAAGNYTIQAVAVDDKNASSTPSVIHIMVIQGNLPPSVTITNPTDNASFPPGTNILVEAAASDPDGSVKQVEFFVNDLSAGIRTVPPYSFVLTNLALGNYALRAVAVDNQDASSTSPTLTIHVSSVPVPPSIDTQPQGLTNQIGTSATFSVLASGSTPLLYQWRFNGSDIGGATNNSLTLSNLQIINSGAYSVVVTNAFGSVTSDPAILLVYAPATITIFSPTNGSEFQAPATVVAAVDSPDKALIARADLFLSRNGQPPGPVGSSTNLPFTVVLTNVLAGSYVLSADAVDIYGGIAATPAPVQFFVRNPPVLTRTPTDASLPPETSVTLEASVDTNGPSISRVLFFVNGAELGEDSEAPFSQDFQTNILGDYSFTAVAISSSGQSLTSAPLALRISIPETIRPSITITSSPPNFTRTNSAFIPIAGTASDNLGLDRVEYQINGGPTTNADGKSSWSFVAHLVPGANTVRVRSVDLRTNASFDAARFFTYVVTAPLAVEVDPPGMGSVTPDLTNAPLEIGKVYTLTARPRSGSLFAGWEGVRGTNNPTLIFEMMPGLTKLVAHFSTNPFPAMAGTYNGVFTNSDANLASVETSGYLSLKLGSVGSFSGKVAMQGKTYPFTGQFHNPSNTSISVIRHGLQPLVLSLTLDPAGLIYGFVTNSFGTTNRTFMTSQFIAEKNPFNWSSHTAPQVGAHPFVLNRDDAPVSHGKAQIRVDGLVQFTGTLPQSGKFSSSSTIAESGNSPFYFSFNKGTEALVGTFRFGNSSAQAVDGDLLWLRPGTNQSLTIEPGP